MTRTDDEQTPYEACIAELDRHATQLGHRSITHHEYGTMVYQSLATYFAADRAEDDIDLLLQYARLPIEALQADPVDGDRTSLDAFDRQVQSLLHHPASRAAVLERLDQISNAIANGDGSAIDDLRDLCRDGWREHPHLFMFRDNIELVLELAFQIGAVDALVDAVTPTGNEAGQLGAVHLFGGTTRTMVFDHLGELAHHDDEIGSHAIDALIGLTAFLETAASAALRLPVRRLTRDHREVLSTHLEAISELLGRDPFLTPTHDADRIPHILRSVIWLANDADNVF